MFTSLLDAPKRTRNLLTLQNADAASGPESAAGRRWGRRAGPTATVTYPTSGQHGGNEHIRLTLTGAPGALSVAGIGGAGSPEAGFAPKVTPGLRYIYRGFTRCSIANRRCRLQIVWRNAGGALLSTNEGAHTVLEPNVWTPMAPLVATAPANAVLAQLAYEFTHSDGVSQVQTGDVFDGDTFRFARIGG